MTCRVRIGSEVKTSVVRYKQLIRKVIKTALEAEKVGCDCEINVTIVDDERIHGLNNEFMHRDRPTDVLSFPMQQLVPGAFEPDMSDCDMKTGRLPLGEMVISLERAKDQAREYGHSVKREIAYLTVHSTLHLLGYDHMDEGEMKAQMRVREEAILSSLGITRE